MLSLIRMNCASTLNLTSEWERFKIALERSLQMKQKQGKNRVQHEQSIRRRNQIILLGLSLIIILSMIISLVSV